MNQSSTELEWRGFSWKQKKILNYLVVGISGFSALTNFLRADSLRTEVSLAKTIFHSATLLHLFPCNISINSQIAADDDVWVAWSRIASVEITIHVFFPLSALSVRERRDH